MANTISTDLLYRVLAGAIDSVRARLGLALAADKDFSGLPAERGYSVTYQVPQSMTAADVTPSATPPAVVDLAPRSVTITATNFKAARFHLTESDLQRIRSVSDWIPPQVEEAAAAVAAAIEDSLWTEYYRFFEETGVAGDAIFGGSTP
ncbi:MAG: hypothetical protein N3A38_15655, partial [Planctomycetota bacterium]|nr:hypothetical protein [Planctomycetota bacterium]